MEIFIWQHKWSLIISSIIFITFSHKVLGRHQIRQYKDRFKRQQGAHLYLPGSFVTEGQEGPESGPWSDWSEPSACSRTCGGGVSTQVRQCQPNYLCEGPDKRHFSCNTQDCPDTGDFRAQQCSEFNNIPFETVTYEWVPYTKGPSPCELNCMPKGQRFYYRHAEKVIDGTRCNDETYDVCVNGQCQPVGCDMMLGSRLREDECRVCGGDGSTCNTVSNTLELNDLQVGYNDILLIPGGATNIVVEEVAPSNNYFAIRNTSGHYYLNGNWRIDLPRTIEFAGSKFHYERYPQGFAAPDKIWTLGPIDEPLFIVLLFQDSAVPVQYKYSVPNNIQAGSESETYAWTFDEFNACSATCGGGFQYRNVSCAGRRSLDPVDEKLCDAARKPETSRKCNEIACEARWVPLPWGNCSVPCGDEGGIQTREISCQQIVSNGYPTLVDKSQCEGPKPPEQQKCNQGKKCATWFTGPWKPCDHLCGTGKQTRDVQCFIKDENNKIQILGDDQCEAIQQKPIKEQECFLRPCEGVDWITSAWSGCDICGLTNETRKIFCATASGQIYSDNLCDEDKKPDNVRSCNNTKDTTCNYLWYASQWSQCSAKCGQGIQTRTIFCGVSTDKGVEKVDNKKCDQTKSFDAIRNCTGTEECDGEWFSGPWGECSQPCGGGKRSKKVVCIKDNEVVDVSHCDASNIIFSDEDCNEHSCPEDAVLPVNKEEGFPLGEQSSSTTTEAISTYTEDDTMANLVVTSQTSFEDSSMIEEDNDEYEIVADDTCEDGEWIEISLPEVTDSEDSQSTKSTEFLDMMFSDGTTIIEETLDGSGDDQSSTTEENNDITTTTYITETKPSNEISTDFSTISFDSTLQDLSSSSEKVDDLMTTNTITDATTGDQTSKLDTELFTSSTVGVSETETVSGSDKTESSKYSEISDVTEESSVTESLSTDSSTSTEPNRESGGTTTVESPANDTPSSTETSTNSDSLHEENTITTKDSSQFTETIDTSESTAGTESTEITASTENTESAESTISTESNKESSTSTESVETTTNTARTESTESTISTENTDSTESTMSTESNEESTESSTSTESVETSTNTENTVSTENSESTINTESTESTMTTESMESTISTVTSESTEETISTIENEGATGSTESSSKESMSLSSTEPSIRSDSSESEINDEYIESEPGPDDIPPPPPREPIDDSEEITTTQASTTDGTSEKEDTSEYTSTSAISTTEETMETTPGTTDSSSTDISTSILASESTTITEEIGSTESSSTSTQISTETTPFSTETTPFSTETNPISTETNLISTETTSVSTETTPISTETTPISTETTSFSTDVATSTDVSSTSEIPSSTNIDKLTETTNSLSTETTEYMEVDVFSSSTESNTNIDQETTHILEIFKTKQKMCRRKKTPKCRKSKYGCCWDNIHSAKGPFDKGCPTPKTCKESTYGCCDDGVSAALGPKNRGCPESHCNETLFGCCWDKKTPAKGNDNEGCPELPPACLDSKWGCCPDNVKEATGPDLAGCLEEEEPEVTTTLSPIYGNECSKTEYGCCPDGLPAKGPQFQGCDTPCGSTTYGCCPDGVSPAHGYGAKGCCLNGLYGCCPDDVTLARGPNGEGCECEYYPYGCCPDNTTAAQGYYNEGCGCSYSTYGCCPDDKTTASGPNYEGCPCHTYQFGCCPDGVSIAQGPHQQGCDCRLSQYGCCSDEKTPAQGENKQGCSCDVSKYGCCLDGVTEALGENFEGCKEVPLDQQNACSLPRQPGPCRNFTVKWFFDMSYGGCSRFWYGGCDGNDNRFKTKEECEGVCVKPQGKERCNLPKVPGSCEGYFLQWYYDKESRHCSQFVYSGCLGNNNKFDTVEECNELCASENVADPCSQPPDEGPCQGGYRRFFFDKESDECRMFAYGGCKGNTNNFATHESCIQRCKTPGKKRDYCMMPMAMGNCSSQEAKWFYDNQNQQCLPFYYSGCQSNKNNFESKEACQRDCPDEYVKDVCHLPADIGECGNYVNRWYWDTREKTCKQFYYGGCGGNENNYQTQIECEQSCAVSSPKPIETLPETTQRPTIQAQTPAATIQIPTIETPTTTYRAPSLQEICSFTPDPGPCSDYTLHYYYDGAEGVCKNFTYGGCGGNYNNFENEEICLRYCASIRTVHAQTESVMTAEPPIQELQTKSSQEICQLPADQGSCPEASHKRWYFDNIQGECKAFIYSGCGGNQNNFKTFQKCLEFCREFLPYTGSHSESNGNQECQLKFDECNTLRCPYGIEAYVDENDCTGCRCRDPCKNIECPEQTQCGIDLNRNKTDPEDADFVAICREQNKAGECPRSLEDDLVCENECRNDADCALHLKCCNTSCGGTVCAEPSKPENPITLSNEIGFTQAPMNITVPYPPQIDEKIYEPRVSGLIGDQVILNCAVSGNPNPNIVWSKDNTIIDGTKPRYRIRLDQTLQIITLHKTDSGIYVCTADNKIGRPIQNQIKLEVSDTSVDRPVRILNGEDPELLVNNIVTSFNSPVSLECYALGWPLPAVTWWKEDELIPLRNKEYEVTKYYSLIINSVQLHNLGVYTCQAYNGKGKAASWSVTVRAKGPYYSTNPKDIKYLQYVVDRPEPGKPSVNYEPSTELVSTPSVQRPTPQPYTSPVYSTEPNPYIVDPNEIAPEPVYTVPVRANITATDGKYHTGTKVEIRCDVYGYPPPQVKWYKDGVPVTENNKIAISDANILTIKSAEKSDSGRYECEAQNLYSKDTSSVDISIEGMYIDPSCTDNPFFANCKLIIKAKYCNHKYYARFCCRSCTEAGELPMDLGQNDKQNALNTNFVSI